MSSNNMKGFRAKTVISLVFQSFFSGFLELIYKLRVLVSCIYVQPCRHTSLL